MESSEVQMYDSAMKIGSICSTKSFQSYKSFLYSANFEARKNQIVKKPPSKVAKKYSICFSSLASAVLSCPNGPNRRTHVSKCGL